MADMLNITLSGLRAFQTALNTTSHNIANVATEGYSRQRVDLSTQTPQGVAGITTGSGVRIDGVERNASDLLSAQMRRSSSTYARLDAYTEKAGALNNLFADSKTGLSAALQKFTNALQGVANTPSSVSARQVLLSEADGLVTRLQTYEARLDDIDTEINEQLRAEAVSINSIAQNIARLNQEIARFTSVGGAAPNDLLDARDQQLADLASRIDTSVVKQDDGSINVFIGKGQPLVLGFLPSEVVAQQDAFQPNRITLGLKTPSGVVNIENSLSGGSVGGLLDFRREMLDPSRNELGRMAVALTEVTNAQHHAGQDLYGDLGGDFFSVGGVEVLPGRTNTSTASLSAVRTGAADLTPSDYIVRFDGTWKVSRTDNGQQVPFTVGGGGELQFEGLEVTVSGTPAAGDRFLVRPTGNAVDGLGLLINDPSRVAAAAPIRSAAVTGNAGTAVISAGEVLDVSDPLLRDPVTIRFTDPPGNWEAVDATNTVIGTGAYVPGGNIEVNGWRVQITGQPAAGDSFTVSSNTGGVGDNRNALKLAAVLGQGVLSGGTESLDAAAGRLVSTVGVTTNGANASLEAQKIIFDDSVAAIDSIAGVNLDEEAANMMRYQQAYQAAAQMIRVTQTIFDTIISSVGR